MRLKIENWIQYRYERPVSFSRHIIRLYPRSDQKIVTRFLRTEINLPNDVQYRRDLFDNLVASCFLPEAGDALEIKVQLEVELWPTNPFHFLLAPHAAKLPFSYDPEEERVLAPYRAVSSQEQADTEMLWHLDGSRDTVSALVDLARTLHAEIGYEVREEGAARMPAETLALRSGACRDIALLCATILRKVGLAVRVVSGFLCEFQVAIETQRAERGLHAWVEIFLPGAGWIGIDPTNGTFCDHHFIPTAVGINMADIASVQGSYFGKEEGKFTSRLDMGLIIEKELNTVAESVEKAFSDEALRLTMGAEPTFVPIDTEAPEWNYVALGASKLEYAYKFANQIIKKTWPEAIVLYTPGKLYPGETNPRWAIQLLQPPYPLVEIHNRKKVLHKPGRKLLHRFKQHLLREFKLENVWLSASEPGESQNQVWILPLDHREGRWISEKWNLRKIKLVQAEGPAGLRLPLEQLGAGFTKRALVLEVLANTIDVFLPPLLTEPWIQLVRAVHSAIGQSCRIRWQGYVPVDLPATWKRLGFSADPGVLEVNLPPCDTWKEFQEWLVNLDALSQAIGLKTFKARAF
ncbi:MAG: transglutaminase family protein, partial [Verrucomicrobia bacterium]|nr:transglutaminase family protein [Verrucomicrobiota bacterium]